MSRVPHGFNPRCRCETCGLAQMLRAQVSLFVSIWQLGAPEGTCDALGGAEFRRVLGEWIAGGCASDVAAFITRRANVGPFDDLPPGPMTSGK